ncbi:MAG: HEAT repeat domain-containing protein [Planctomycetes bacterium]|nr:HEAT repeat domain-containing protein [Planctomycetota bacterium]
MPAHRLSSLRCLALGVVLLGGLAGLRAAAAADEVDDLHSALKRKAYGDYWDRLDAARKLGSIGSRRAAEVLCEFLDDAEPPVIEAVVLALSRIKDPEAVKFLSQNALLGGRSEKTRAHAAWALELMKEKDTIPPLLRALGDASVEVRACAANALGAISEKEVAKPLSEKLSSSSPPPVSVAILHALGRLKENSVYDAVAALFGTSNALVRAAALRAGASLGAEKALEALQKGTTATDAPVRIAALESCQKADFEASLAASIKALDDEAWQVRVAAIYTFQRLWDKRSLEPLIARMEKEKGRLRLDIGLMLKDLTGKDIGFDAKSWRGWWEGHKADFEMPPRPKKGQKREAKDDGTQAAFFNIPVLSDRVTFVIDYSGSMYKEDPGRGTPDGKTAAAAPKRKIDLALEELQNVLNRLKPEVRLNLVVMSTEAVNQKCRKAAPQLVPATEENKKRLMDFAKATCKKLEEIKRGRGDMYDSIRDAMADPECDTVFVLSDGRPSSGEVQESVTFFHRIAMDNEFKKVMIHTVLTGTKGIDQEFMDRIAEETNGIAVAR